MNHPIFVLNGPNLNLLGEREPAIYGRETLADIEARCRRRAEKLGYTIDFRQTNWEGALVESVHEARKAACAIVINPAGLSFNSIPLLDSLKMFDGPKIEVHLSNIHQREPLYHRSLVSMTAHGVIAGMGGLGYELALEAAHASGSRQRRDRRRSDRAVAADVECVVADITDAEAVAAAALRDGLALTANWGHDMSNPIDKPWSFPGEQLDALLDEAGIDLLLASSKHNIRYLLNGHHHHFFAHMDAIGISRYLPVLAYPRGRPGDAVYVANRNEKDSIAVRAAEGRPLWVASVLPAASGSAEAMGVAVAHLRRVGLSPGTIGVEMALLPADAFLVLRDAFPDARIVEAHRPLERLRAVKSPAELAVLREASELVIDAILAVIGGHGPGTTKRQLEAALRREEVARGLVFEYALITVGRSHGRAPSDEVWQEGDILSLDSGGNLEGYIGDLCRMAILGEPDPELEDLLGLVDRVQMAARAPIRPGVPGAAIYDAVRDAMAALPANASFVAHGMGLIGHESPRLTAKGPVPYPDSDATLPLQAGMVVSIETTLPHPTRGFIKLEDTVAVTDAGWEGFGDRGARLEPGRGMSRPLPLLAISHLTAPELPPSALLRAAAAAGCQGAGLRLIPVLPGHWAYALMDDPALLRETRDAVTSTGVTVRDLEIVMLRPDTDVGTFGSFLEAGAQIGAKHVLVAGYDDDEARLTANLAAFCDLAAPFGLTGDLEFMPWSMVPDLATARRVVEAAGRPNGGVLLDPLHFARSSGQLADLASVPRALWHYWQICDAPAEHPGTTEGLLYTAREERLFPGEGGLDLLGMARVMPADLPLSIEVPKATMARTVPGTERIRLAADATRALLARVDA